MTRLDKLLQEQYRFLVKSSKEYDAGDTTEGKRIALILRVLFHNTKISYGLIPQIEKERNIRMYILSRNIGFQDGLVFYLGATLLTKNGELSYQPMMDLTHPGLREILVEDWWKMGLIVVEGKRFTRKDIMLSLVNKEGGAHVDPFGDDEFTMLTSGDLLKLSDHTGKKVDGIDHVLARENGFYAQHAIEKYFPDLV